MNSTTKPSKAKNRAKTQSSGCVAVVSSTGKQLMPTTSRRARQLLDAGRAAIYKYRPVFTIQLLDRADGDIQPMELKVDTGYQDIGISVCSEKHEFLHREYRLLTDEPEKHNARMEKRRTRRNRKRYRKPRFDNRKGRISQDGFAPSIRNKRDRHVDLVACICEVMPVKEAYVEMGSFDTQALKAVEEGKPLPKGEDYQHGERYGIATLREAVFTRDHYTCICCGRNALKDGAILHVHHVGFWKHDRTNRMANLATVCEKCHTSKNHQPGGKLHGLEPKRKPFKGATFMTIVRFSMYRLMQEACPDVAFHMTYGAATKLARQDLEIPKGHANDAYAMGKMHPRYRARLETFQKRRRNNRILERFYDAVVIDTRDGAKKKGAQLGCNRTKRSIPRDNPGNERPYRGIKTSKGHRSIRKGRHQAQAGDLVEYQGRKYTVKTARFKHNKKRGDYETVELAETGKQMLLEAVVPVRFVSGWVQTN